MNPTKFDRLNVFSQAHALLFLSSLSNASTSPISFAVTLKSLTTAIKLNLVSPSGYRAILCLNTSITFSGNSSAVHPPCEIGCGCNPSNSYNFPSTGVYAMKWYTSPSSSWLFRTVSSTNGEARANALCALRISSELESASPRRSGGNPAVKSLKEWSSGPMLMG